MTNTITQITNLHSAQTFVAIRWSMNSYYKKNLYHEIWTLRIVEPVSSIILDYECL
jgi:hypothetical protein